MRMGDSFPRIPWCPAKARCKLNLRNNADNIVAFGAKDGMLDFECIDAYYKISTILANSEDYFWRRFLANRRDKKWADGVKFLQRFRHVGFF